MISAIVRREIQDNLLSFKFIACVLVSVILAGASTVASTGAYRDRLKEYDKGVISARDALAKVPVYSYLQATVYRKPSVLSIFVPGVESRAGSHTTISHQEIPATLEGGPKKNEFASVFSFFDLSAIIVAVLTILAILLSYAGISEEKESNLLSLVLSNAVPKSRILAGKYLGGLISLAIALAICFITSSLVLLFSPDVALDSGFYVSFGIIFVFALFYLSVILLFGIFISCLAKSSFQSVVIALAFYLISIFLLPLLVNSLADGASNRIARDSGRNVDALLDKRYGEAEDMEKAIPAKRSWLFAKSISANSSLFGRLNPPETLAHYEAYFEKAEKLKVDYAQKAFALRQAAQLSQAKIDRLRNTALALSPAFCFSRAAELEAETGREGLASYFREMTLYWHQYIRYLDEKNAFSLRFFYPYPRELPHSDKALVENLSRFVAEGKEPMWRSPVYREISARNREYEAQIVPLDLADLPLFVEHKDDLAQRATAWLPSVLVLAVENIVFFALAYFAFARLDPRMDR